MKFALLITMFVTAGDYSGGASRGVATAIHQVNFDSEELCNKASSAIKAVKPKSRKPVVYNISTCFQTRGETYRGR